MRSLLRPTLKDSWGKLQSSRTLRLCKTCREINSLDVNGSVRLRRLMANINTSAKRGCLSCELIFAIVKLHGINADEVFLAKYPQSLRIWTWDGIGMFDIDICPIEDTECPWSIGRCERKAAIEDPNLAARKIKAWLDECVQLHPSCQRPEVSTLPSRVIEILGPKELRLFENTKRDQHARYACLSHCWGGRVPLQTLRENFNTFQTAGIPWDDLPLTFQHAIDMTYRLGLRYIWIDSLCIVQDDLEDWRHEGSKMAEIYSGSHVTLAASKAENNAAGFYMDSTQSKAFDTLLDQFDLNLTGHSYEFLIHRRLFSGDYGQLPLFSRAWFFQERYLSARVVHFAGDALYWECPLHSSDEREAPTSLYRSLEGSADLPRKAKADIPMRKHSIDLGNTDVPFFLDETRIWWAIVQTYSCLHVTYVKDRLPAVQGIAKLMQRKRQCPYYAGIWETSLLPDILWFRSAAPHLPQDSKHTPPSWSWASTMGNVKWDLLLVDSENFDAKASLVSAETYPVGDDPMGEVSGGRLTLRAHCLPGNRQRHLSQGSLWLDLDMRLRPDNVPSIEYPLKYLLDDTEDVAIDDDGVILVLIAKDKYKPHFLILRSLCGDEELFKRIGYGTGPLIPVEEFQKAAPVRTITIV